MKLETLKDKECGINLNQARLPERFHEDTVYSKQALSDSINRIIDFLHSQTCLDNPDDTHPNGCSIRGCGYDGKHEISSKIIFCEKHWLELT